MLDMRRTCGLRIALSHDLQVAVHASELGHLLPSWGNRRQTNIRYCRSVITYYYISIISLVIFIQYTARWKHLMTNLGGSQNHFK